MTNRYTVTVTKDYLVFCAAHFITYDGHHCERIHGHNYRVSAEVSAPLDGNHYVFDFIALRDHLMALTAALDHRMLVPMKSPLIHVETSDHQVTLRFENRTWSFPREDCVPLPVENTTAELLARYLGEQLRERLRTTNKFEPESLKIEVEESFGQSATYEWRS